MSDSTPLLLAPAVFAPLKSLLLASFGPVFDETLYPGCGTECLSGEDGFTFAFPFNDIESTSVTRVSKLQFFWFLDPYNTQVCACRRRSAPRAGGLR